MAVINTNLLSIVTNNNLFISKKGLASAIERLASGLRINSAKDDAAGQGIANRLTTNIRGFAQAKRNISDGISIAQTAESALSQSNSNLHRIRELTVQAKNGTYSQEDLNTIQAEIRTRLDEIDKIAEQTQFNGKTVLNSYGSLTLQTGVNDDETVAIKTRAMRTEELGIHYFNVNGLDDVKFITQEQANELTNHSGLLPNQLKISDASAQAAVSAFTQRHQLTANALNTDQKLYQGSDGNYYMKIDISQPVVSPNDEKFKALRIPANTTPETSLFIKVSKGDYQGNEQFTIQLPENMNSVILGKISPSIAVNAPNGGLNFIQDNTSTQYFTQAELLSILPNLTPSQVDSLVEPIRVSYNFPWPVGSNGFAVSDEITTEMIKVAPNVGVKKIEDKYFLNFIGAAQATEIGFYEGQNVYWDITDRLDEITFFTSTPSPSTLYIRITPLYLTGTFNELFIDTEDAVLTGNGEPSSSKTNTPLNDLDVAMAKIDEYRGELGAVMNRLDSAAHNISTSKINLEAARSRIEDTDYAIEVSNMSRALILQQAGTSVLSQANQTPELVLQLLK